MAKGKKGNLMGAWAFLIGILLAIIFGFISGGPALIWILVIIGLIVGLLNVADSEAQTFLIAGAILVIVSYFGSNVLETIKIANITFLQNILQNILMLFVPATIIVALKSVFSIAKA